MLPLELMMNEIELKVGKKIYRLTNKNNANKYNRAVEDAGLNAPSEEILAHYDKFAGYIQDEDGNKVENGKFWSAKLKGQLVQRLIDNEKANKNAKYGELIVQTNQVQFYLRLQIITRSLNSDAKFNDRLNRLMLGGAITIFWALSKQTEKEQKIIKLLKTYNDNRRDLAHNMSDPKKALTGSNCKLAIENGEKIITYLKNDLQERLNQLSNV